MPSSAREVIFLTNSPPILCRAPHTYVYFVPQSSITNDRRISCMKFLINLFLWHVVRWYCIYSTRFMYYFSYFGDIFIYMKVDELIKITLVAQITELNVLMLYKVKKFKLFWYYFPLFQSMDAYFTSCHSSSRIFSRYFNLIVLYLTLFI